MHLQHLLPRRNSDKLMITSGTPRKCSKVSTEMARGNGTGGELDGKLLHLRHLLLSPLPHLMVKILDLRHHLLTSLLHLRHLLLSPFRFKILILLVPMLQQTLAHLLDLHLRHLLHLPHFLVTSHLHLQHLLLSQFLFKILVLLVPMLHLDLAHLLDLHLRHLRQLPHLLFFSSP